MICTHTVGAEYPCVKALDALWRPYELRTAHDGHRRGDAPIVRPYEPVRAEGELVLLETKEAGRQRAKDRHRRNKPTIARRDVQHSRAERAHPQLPAVSERLRYPAVEVTEPDLAVGDLDNIGAGEQLPGPLKFALCA